MHLPSLLWVVVFWTTSVQQESDIKLSNLSLHRNDIQPTYVIVAPKTIHPSTLYGVGITLLENPRMDYKSISVRIEISRNKQEVISVIDDVPVASTHTVYLRVPSTCTAGQYKLKVEGNYPLTSRGSAFSNETEIEFSPQFLSIVIQTSRPIYKTGQTVYFRVVLLNTELKPYEDTVTIFVLNSHGIVMRRWISAQINNGVISEKFSLPELVDDGFWKIRVQALDQIQDQAIRVEKYFSPLFEVHVTLPAYTLDTDKYIAANISAQSAVERIARGNATISVYGRYLNGNESMRMIWEDKVSMKNGIHYMLIPMESIHNVMGSLENVEVRVEAVLTEFLYRETMTGFSHTRIISSSINLYFLGSSPMVFKPGMLFEGYAVVAYRDKEKLSEEKLEASTLRIEVTAQYESGSSTNLPEIVVLPKDEDVIPNGIDDSEWNGSNRFTTEYADVASADRYREEGILYFKFEVPPKVSEITLRGYYQDSEGDSAQAEKKVVQFFSPQRKFLRVWTSTHDAEADEYAVFHVKTNFRLESFQYMVLSKGFLLYAGSQIVQSNGPTITTFAVSVSMSMAPGFKLVVYHVTLQGELISDSVFVPVEGFNGYEIYLIVNQGKDHTKKTAQAIMPAKAGAFMGINSMRTLSYYMQAGNEISKSRVIESLFSFENRTRPQSKVKWRSREGLIPDEIVYLPNMAGGRDSHETFMSSGVIVFTDSHIAVKNGNDSCSGRSGYASCLSGDCFLLVKKCDGYNDCDDGSDEIDCIDEHDHYEYQVMRFSRSDELYDTAGNDWGWQEMNGEYGGEEYLTMPMPDVSDDWYFMGFCFSRILGFTIVDTPIAFSSTRPFMMHLEGPSVCRRGEQLGLRLLLVNNEAFELLALVMLHDSPDYKFVHVEENGIVSSYGARLSAGTHQHLVYLAPFAQQHVDLPVAPAVDQGDIDIVISAMTQVGNVERIHKVTVLGEGAIINKHTSVYLDLKNRALVLQYLDIYVEESPIVSYENWRRYVFGSTSGEVTLTGDIIGPAFPTVPLTAGTVLKREVKGTDGRVFEFAVNIWTLHYLRLTNQLQWSLAKQVLEDVNVIFAQIMKRFDKRGWFKNWDTSQPSVWLTSWAIRIFKHASFQDWENILYVEPTILSSCLEWILEHQTDLGSFQETTWYDEPLDRKMRAKKVNGVHSSEQYRNVSLTAHVLITIQEVMQIVQGAIRTEAAKASFKAVRYLERQLHSTMDPFDIAITTYALTLCESVEKEYAFKLLQKNSREVGDGLMYWSRVAVPQNPVRMENHRPFIGPRYYQRDDTAAVEATSYALMVYLMREGVTSVAEKIVQWLTSVRMGSSAFISTTDSVLGLQALTEYAFRARLRDITDMTVTVELPSTPGFRHTLHVDNTTFTKIQKLPIPNVWSHLNVIAKGSGQAVVQMDINYGVDYEPLKERPIVESFELDVTDYYSPFRNKTFITIQSCFRWILNDPPVSGSAVLEVNLPTGYHLLESEAEELVESGIHPLLRDARTVEGKTYWYFEHISQKRTCFNHTVKRWFPVANISLVRQVQLYETYARENFIMTLVNSTPLYVLNICEVCGSYQCPYCPYYSETVVCIPSNFLVVSLVTIVYITSRILHKSS